MADAAVAPPVVPAAAAAVTPPAAPAAATPTSNAQPSLLTPEAPKAPVTPPAADAKKEEAKAPPAEIKLTLPKDSLLTQAQVDKIAAISRERGLSQEAATAVMEAQAVQLKEFADTNVKQYEERIAARNAEWDAALKANPEYGGEKLKEWGEGSYQVLLKYGGEEAIKLLRDEGLTKHPVVAKMLWNIHKASKPDKIVAPHAAAVAPGSKSVAESLFPSAVKK